MRAVILIFDLWLLIIFEFFYLCLILLLSNYFYLFIGIHKDVWSNRQDKRVLTYGTSKNVTSKPARGS